MLTEFYTSEEKKFINRMMNIMIDQVHLSSLPKPFSAEQSDRMTKGSRWKLPGTKLSQNLLDKNYKIFNS